jgi:hypothetical protein
MLSHTSTVVMSLVILSISDPASFRQRIFRPTTNDHERRSLRLGLCGGREDAVNPEALFRQMIEGFLERGQILSSIDNPRALALHPPGAARL